MTAGPARVRPVPLWLLRGAVAAFLILKLAFSLIVPPNEDEAYYWLWGQNLQLSYFDHAPLVGWMQGFAHLVLGWNLLALRGWTFVTLLGTALIFRFWAKRLAPDDWHYYFWATLAIYLASPLLFAITSLAYPDHWLMFFCLLSAHCFAIFFGDQMDGRPLRHRYLYLGAVVLGLAALAKYNAVVMGLGVAAYVVFSWRLRPLLANPHLYLAAFASVAMLAPVLYWNATHDFISFRFQLWERYGPGGLAVPRLEGLLGFVAVSALYLSPFLVVPLIGWLRRPAGEGFAGALSGLGKAILIVSSLPMLALSLYVPTAPHWNIIAFLVFFGFAAGHFWRRWLLVTHLVVGTLAVAVICGYYVLFPLSYPPGAGGEREASELYGFNDIGARMLELQAENGARGIGAVYFGASSKLAFAVGSAEVTSFTPTVDGFDFWRNEAEMTGGDFVILDEFRSIEAVRPLFDQIVPLETIKVERFGRQIFDYDLYLGRNYRGSPP